MSDMADVDAIEAIKQVKYRYLRALDTKHWDDFEDTLTEDIIGDYESLWARVRDHYGKGQMPRTVNWITGPSRSGDIEQTILLGAHGPRSVHIVVVRQTDQGR